VERDGFAYVKTDSYRKFFPEWYANSFHAEWYIREKFAQYLTLVEYIPRGMGDLQDLVVLRKP
jgi:hypothetical protein